MFYTQGQTRYGGPDQSNSVKVIVVYTWRIVWRPVRVRTKRDVTGMIWEPGNFVRSLCCLTLSVSVVIKTQIRDRLKKAT